MVEKEISQCKKEKKQNEKAKMAVDEEDELILCIIIDNDEKPLEEKKKVSFADDDKFKTLHSDLLTSMHETGTMCTIDGQLFYTFTKVDHSGLFCHIINNDTGL